MTLRIVAAYNGLILGGPIADHYGVLSYSDSSNNGMRSVGLSISVKGAGPLQKNAYMTLLRNALVNRKSFTLSALGVDAQNPVYVAVSGDEVTITAINPLFSPSNVGDILYLSDQDRVVQLSSISSSTVAKAYVFPFGSAPNGTGANTTSANILTSIVKCLDATESALGVPYPDAFSGPTVEGDKVGGMDCVASIRRPGDPDDDQRRDKVELDFAFTRPWNEVYPDEGGRVDSTIDVTTDPQGLTVVVFSGKIVAGSVSGVGYLVRGLISQALDTWVSDNLDAISSSATFEQGPSQDRISQDGRSMTFVRSYRQLIVSDTKTTFDDPRITGASFMFKRAYQATHGWISGIQPFTVEAGYSASIKVFGSGAVSQNDIFSFWKSTIKPYLKAMVESIYNGKVSVMTGVDPVYEPATGKVSGTVLFFVRDSGTSVYRFNQEISIQDDEGIEAAKRFDGSDYSSYDFLTGKSCLGLVTITITTLGDPVNAKTGQGSGQEITGGAVEIQGAALAINLPSKSNPGSNTNNEKIVIYPDPGPPSRVFPEMVSGFWRRLSRGYRENVTYFGADPDGVGDRIKVTACQYFGVYAWRSDSSGVTGSIRDTDGILDVGDGLSSIPHGGN